MLSHNDRTLCVVSSGSIRKNGQPVSTIEIKCPYPEKSHTLKLKYELPKKYVLLLMLEMHELGVEELIFVCWMPELTSFLKVTYSEELWIRCGTS